MRVLRVSSQPGGETRRGPRGASERSGGAGRGWGRTSSGTVCRREGPPRQISEESSKRGTEAAEAVGTWGAMGGLSKSRLGVLGPPNTAREARPCHAEKEAVWPQGKGERGWKTTKERTGRYMPIKVQIIAFFHSALHSFPSFYRASQMIVLMTLPWS